MTGDDGRRIQVTITTDGGRRPSRVDVVMLSAEALDGDGKPDVAAGILRGGLTADDVITADASALQELAHRIGAKAYLTDEASPIWAATVDAVLAAGGDEYPVPAIRELLVARIMHAVQADDLSSVGTDACRLATLLRPEDGPRARVQVNMAAEWAAGHGSSDVSAQIATAALSGGTPEARPGVDGARSRFEWSRSLALAGRVVEAVDELDALFGDDVAPELLTADAPRFIWFVQQACAWARTGADSVESRRFYLDALGLLSRVELEGSIEVSRALLVADLDIVLDRHDDAVNALRDARGVADGLDDPRTRDSVFRKATDALQGDLQADSARRSRLLSEFLAWHEAGASAERSELRGLAGRLHRQWGDHDESDRIFRLVAGLGDDRDGIQEGHRRLLSAALNRLIECEPTAIIPVPIGFERPSTSRDPAEVARLCDEVERLGVALSDIPDTAERQVARLACVLARACAAATTGQEHRPAIDSTRPDVVVVSAAADDDAERAPWRVALAAAVGEEPLSGAAAHLLAVIAASAADDVTLLRALRLRRLFDTGGWVVASARCSAAVLVRQGRTDAAIDELVAAAGAPESLDDDDAFRLLRDLRWIGGSEADVGSKQRAHLEARNLWLRMERPDDHPSTAPSGPEISRRNADVVTHYGMVFSHLKGPWQDVWRECATEAIAFLTLYSDDPLADRARQVLTVSLINADDPVDAFAMLCGLFESPGGGGMSDNGAVYHRLLERLPTGRHREFEKPLPDGFSAEWRAKATALAARRLSTSGWYEAAIERVLGELRAEPVLGDFESERVLVDVMDKLASSGPGDPWVAAEDMLLAGGKDSIGWNTRRLLVWYRAFRRKAAGDLAGAVEDALTVADHVSSAGTNIRTVRRDARRILNYALDWLGTVQGSNDGLRERVAARAMALQAPPQDDRAVAGYGAELTEWVKALRSVGSSELAVAAARERVNVAITDTDDTGASGAIDALRETMREAALDGSDEWLAELTTLRSRCMGAQLRAAHISVLWWRAYRYRALDRHDEALSDVAEASSLWAPGLDVTPRLSILRLTTYCLEWTDLPDSVLPAQEYSSLALARVEETHDDSDWWAAGAGLVRAKALVALDRPAEALDVLRGVRDAADRQNKGWQRDEICDVVRRAVAQQVGLHASERALQLGEFLVWHACGASDDRAEVIRKAAVELSEWGADAAVVNIWSGALADADGATTTDSMVRAIALYANALIVRQQHELGNALCTIAEPSMTDVQPQTRHLLQVVWLLHLNALGDVDSALSMFDECMLCLSSIDSRVEWLTAALRTVQAATILRSDIYAIPTVLVDEIHSTIAEGYLPQAAGEQEQLRILLLGLKRSVPPALAGASENREATEPAAFSSLTELLETFNHHDSADSEGEDLLLGRLDLTIQSLESHARTPDERWMLAVSYVMRAMLICGRAVTRSEASSMGDVPQEWYETAVTGAFNDAKRGLTAFDDYPQARGLAAGYATIAATIAQTSLRDDVRAERLSWIRDRAASDALALDARAAASRSLARRETLLAAADGAWEALATASDEDSRMIAQIVAVRRASLVMADSSVAVPKVAGAKGRVTNIVAGVGLPQEIVDLELQDEPLLDDGELARAASATVLQALGDSEVAVRPRPAVRMPDGTIALASQLRAASADGSAILTPVVVPLG